VSCSGNASSLTIEEQKQLMSMGSQKVAVAAAAASSLAAAAGPTAFPAAMRMLPLGQDRTGSLFWSLRCAPVLAGGQCAHLICLVVSFLDTTSLPKKE
jgi:hypothetical protein